MLCVWSVAPATYEHGSKRQNRQQVPGRRWHSLDTRQGGALGDGLRDGLAGLAAKLVVAECDAHQGGAI